MTIAVLRLWDIAFRSLFIIFVLHLLEERDAGRFGLLCTLVAVVVFVGGYERYIAVQRQIVAAAPSEAANLLSAATRLFAVNHALLALPFFLLCVTWLSLSAYEAILAIAIAAVEHVFIEFYRLIMVVRKGFVFLWVAMIRSALMLAVVTGRFWIDRSPPELVDIIEIWASASALALLIVLIACRIYRVEMPAVLRLVSAELASQYHASFTHFLIGAAAFGSAQIDRIVVGAVLGLDEAGQYFRILFIAGGVYQATTVFLLNRALPHMYADASRSNRSGALNRLRSESVKTALLYSFLIVAVLSLSLGGRGTETMLVDLLGSGLRAELLAGLLLAYMLRAIADYNSVFLNSVGHEKDVLMSHCLAIVVAMVLTVVLGKVFGIAGAVSAVAGGASALLLASTHFRRKLASQRVKSSPY